MIANVEVDLLDRIYEAALVPERWPEMLDAVCARTDLAAGGLVMVGPDRIGGGLMTERYRATYEAYAAHGGRYVNIRMERALRRNHQGFLRDLDLCSEEELANDPIYRDFLIPFGLGWTVGSAVLQPEGRVFVFDFAREIERGPIHRESVRMLDVLRPHLARAAVLSARIGDESARTTTQILSTLGLPAAVLSRDGRILVHNDRFETLRNEVTAVERICRVDFRFELAEPAARGNVDGSDAEPVVRSFPLATQEGQSPLVVHLLPIRRSARDLFAGAATIAVIVAVTPVAAPSADLVASLFDLTPSEARVARAIANGSTVDATAQTFGVSAETVRKQLKAVMGKTGVGRQVDLVRLLLGAGLPLRTD